MSKPESVVIRPKMNNIDVIILDGCFLLSIIIMSLGIWTKQIIGALAFGLIGLYSLGNICWQFLRFHRFAVILEEEIVRIHPSYRRLKKARAAKREPLQSNKPYTHHFRRMT